MRIGVLVALGWLLLSCEVHHTVDVRICMDVDTVVIAADTMLVVKKTECE